MSISLEWLGHSSFMLKAELKPTKYIPTRVDKRKKQI